MGEMGRNLLKYTLLENTAMISNVLYANVLKKKI